MRSPLQPRAKALTGGALLAHYLAAKARGLPLYDDSWTERSGGFCTWRRGVPRPAPDPASPALLDKLVRLGVLERIEGPIPREQTANAHAWAEMEDFP